MKKFFLQAISKDEKYVSILVIFALLFTGMSVYLLIKEKDIPSNLLTLIIWLYGFIAANSSIDGITDKLRAINRKDE